MLYSILLLVHILMAVVSVGSNITYAVWIRRATAHPDSLAFTLRTIKTIDDRLANPGYFFILLTGIGMVLTGPWELTTPWIELAILLWVVMLVIGVAGYTPTLRKQIAMAESGGIGDPEYKRLAGRGLILGMALGVLVLVIIYLMVFKPALWG